MRRAAALVTALAASSVIAAMPALSQADSTTDTVRSSVARTGAARLGLVVNVPAFRLDVFEDSLLTRTFNVAVGMPAFPTPRGSFAITSIEWNPWWFPPPAEWAAEESITPPGPSNPMGRVKLFFRTYYFFHGTPLETSLGQAASHGCVRMANADAIALARLVQRYATPEVSSEQIDGWLLDTTRTHRVTIDSMVPVTLTYEVAEVRGDSLLLHPDIYGLARGLTVPNALAALAAVGIDTASVDRPQLNAAATEARQHHVAIALIELLAPVSHSVRSPAAAGSANGWLHRQVPRAPLSRQKGHRLERTPLLEEM